MMIGHYAIDQPRCGLENMAIDQAMLEQTAADSVLRVRFYRWNEPTISLGYFQRLQDFLDYEAGCQRPVVRRATGGGAIVHHHDWTYSISAPAAVVSHKPQLGASSGLYDCVHQAVVAWLLSIGISADLWSLEQAGRCYIATGSEGEGRSEGEGHGNTARQDERAGEGKHGACHFLCFHRRHAGDVVVQGSKVLGSAQRRHAGAILQHGSLLLSQSSYAPSLPGLQQLTQNTEKFALEDFSGRIIQAISQCYQIAFQKWESTSPLAPPSDDIRKRLESQKWIGRI